VDSTVTASKTKKAPRPAKNPAPGSKSDNKAAPRPGLRGPKAEKTISLALQGGGAHGAFTWGVLDEILHDGRLAIEAISGTSAGAMNAVVMVEGFIEGGIEGARRQLEQFWRGISIDSSYSTLQRNLINRLMGQWTEEGSPGSLWLDFWSRTLSPYDTNPLNINPLRDVLSDLIDFKKVRKCQLVHLFIAATNVRTGKIALFNGDTLTPDHVMASTCLPTMFQAVEIDGEAYWDGGYLGNPALYPLFYEPKTNDVLLVQVNPVSRQDIPRTARDIQNRLTEVTFNATMLREFRAIKFVTDLIDSGILPKDMPYKRVNMHRIDGGAKLAQISAGTRGTTEWNFLQHLRDLGRASARAWLKVNYDGIGEHSTFDLAAEIS
jgi:NTE family protein